MEKEEKDLLIDLVENPDKELHKLINDSSLLKITKKENALFLIKSVSMLKSLESNKNLTNIVREINNERNEGSNRI